MNVNEIKLRKNSKKRLEVINKLETVYKQNKEYFKKDYVIENADVFYDDMEKTGFLYFSMNHITSFNLK